ncbi:SURF1 family protein [Chitinolyticbacter meiyuanensis]|uniref:SURF1 family protein n=1 Tax=Chitinolyticbacter meiyuanensis TaxID=682798 RepID=UPI001651D797|nr:SURF1 family protein [Chitinolyticbacter meiyuanensis]
MAGLLALVLLTLLLGGWQWSRMQEKEALFARYRAAATHAPLAWAGGAPPGDYRQVQLAGHWLPERELTLAPRTHEGQIGFEVVSPFQLQDGQIVLVNRGWLVQGSAIPPTGSVALVELQPWPRFLELAQTHPEGNHFQNIDARRYAAWAGGRQPVAYVRALGSATPFARSAGPGAIGPERHLGYALTWWAMSAIGLLLCWRFYRSNRGEADAIS